LLSSDIRSGEDIDKQINSCDIMILDGIHPSCQSIKELLKNSNTEVYITHGDYATLQHKYAEILNEQIKLAKENVEIIF